MPTVPNIERTEVLARRPRRGPLSFDFVPGKTNLDELFAESPLAPDLPLPKPPCKRPGCENLCKRTDADYCSIACRNMVLRTADARDDAARARVSRWATQPEEVRQAYRLMRKHVPVGEWPVDVRQAYTDYINNYRAKRRQPAS